jgi:ribosomal protein S18 acetylase RimI-like enzyme
MLELRRLSGEEIERWRSFRKCWRPLPNYFQRVTGHPPGPSEALSTYAMLHRVKQMPTSLFLEFFLNETMVGCVGIVRGYPDSQTAYLGLLLLREDHIRRGIGSAAYRNAESEVRAWTEIQKIRLAVIATNREVLPFWERQGFRRTGKIKPWRQEKIASEAILLEKQVLRI